MKFLILCVVVASFFVVSFGDTLETSHQKVSLLRHGLNKRMRKRENMNDFGCYIISVRQRIRRKENEKI